MGAGRSRRKNKTPQIVTSLQVRSADTRRNEPKDTARAIGRQTGRAAPRRSPSGGSDQRAGFGAGAPWLDRAVVRRVLGAFRIDTVRAGGAAEHVGGDVRDPPA